MLSHNHPDNSNELLSAYIDDAVDVGERRRAETYIQTCSACAQEVRELRMFRDLLREIPTIQPRRSFTLDPAAVAPPRRLLFPTLRWATLVAAMLFLVVVGVDALGVGKPANGGVSFSTAQAPDAAQESMPFAAPAQGGSAETGAAPEAMLSPAASPAVARQFEGGSPAASASPAVAAEMGPTAVASELATMTAGGGSASAAASPAPYPAAGAVSPESTAVTLAVPEVARNAPASPMASPPAAGAADQAPQAAFKANDPAGADTATLDQAAPAQGAWWSSLTLRLAEVVLGVIALLFGAAALWTWRRQM